MKLWTKICRGPSPFRVSWFAPVLLACLLGPMLRAQEVIQRLHTFPAGTHASDLAQCPDGDFYGTTLEGGTYGQGTIFRFKPGGVFETVFSFDGITNGSAPRAGLVLANDGVLYGSTSAGGAYGKGTVYKLTLGGAFTQLLAFDGTHGTSPVYDLIQASDGNLYGVCNGGSTGTGTVFQVTLGGAVSTLASFGWVQAPVYEQPTEGVVEGADGLLYGMWVVAANISIYTTNPAAIYRVAPNLPRTNIYSFSAQSPYSPGQGLGLSAGADGFLYLPLLQPQQPGAPGGIFRVSTNGVLARLAAFNTTNGFNPWARMVLGADGAFYGVTTAGGPYRRGNIYRFTTNGILSLVAAFNGTNGAYPTTALVLGGDGNLYGTTPDYNGDSGIFRLVSPPLLSTSTVPDGLVLSWPSFIGGAYEVDYASSLRPANWAPLFTNIVATASMTSVTDTAVGEAGRFYRLVLLP